MCSKQRDGRATSVLNEAPPASPQGGRREGDRPRPPTPQPLANDGGASTTISRTQSLQVRPNRQDTTPRAVAFYIGGECTPN